MHSWALPDSVVQFPLTVSLRILAIILPEYMGLGAWGAERSEPGQFWQHFRKTATFPQRYAYFLASQASATLRPKLQHFRTLVTRLPPLVSHYRMAGGWAQIPSREKKVLEIDLTYRGAFWDYPSVL